MYTSAMRHQFLFNSQRIANSTYAKGTGWICSQLLYWIYKTRHVHLYWFYQHGTWRSSLAYQIVTEVA